MKKRNLYVAYNWMLQQSWLKYVPMGIDNIKNVFAFIKALWDELQDVHEYVKKHTDWKGGLVEWKVKWFEKMLDVEVVDFNTKLELDFNDEVLKKNLSILFLIKMQILNMSKI